MTSIFAWAWAFFCVGMVIFCAVNGVAWGAAIWGFNLGLSIEPVVSWIESRSR